MSDRKSKMPPGSQSSQRTTRSSNRIQQAAQSQGIKNFAGFTSIKASTKRGTSAKDEDNTLVQSNKKKAKVHTSTSLSMSSNSPVDLASGDDSDTATTDRIREADIAFVELNMPETKGQLPNSIFETVMYVSSQKNENKEADERSAAYGPNPHKRFMAHKHKPSVLAHVLTQFEIPADLERSSKFGIAYSGLCVEDRILVMFETGQLVPKGKIIDSSVRPKNVKGTCPAALQMCYSCGKKGHLHWECPSACD